MEPPGQSHRFIIFSDPKPNDPIIRGIATRLMNFYLRKNLSRTKLLKHPQVNIHWEEKIREEKVARVSSPLSLSILEDYLTRTRKFDPADFTLYKPEAHWLDDSLDFWWDSHFHYGDGKEAINVVLKPSIAPNYPLAPKLDREGWAITSLQNLLIRKLASLRFEIVEKSSEVSIYSWIDRVRSLASDSISLIENTLIQLYYKAQYAPNPGWSFDTEKLGPRHGQRLRDKLKWVHTITGNHLSAHSEVMALESLRKVRNHLQHFDPPILCFTYEDIVMWTNEARDVATLNLKIRDAMDCPPSSALIEILLNPLVEFVPKNTAPHKRLTQPMDVGYASCSDDMSNQANNTNKASI